MNLLEVHLNAVRNAGCRIDIGKATLQRNVNHQPVDTGKKCNVEMEVSIPGFVRLNDSNRGPIKPAPINE